MDEVRRELRDYVLAHLLPGEDPDQLGDGDDLIESGVLDSLAIVKLITFLGERFGVDVEPAAITVENFASIEAIARFVAGRGAPA